MNVVNTDSITGSRNVSIQAQPVRYQNQPGHNPPSSKCHTRKQALLSNKLLIKFSKCHTGTQA